MRLLTPIVLVIAASVGCPSRDSAMKIRPGASLEVFEVAPAPEPGAEEVAALEGNASLFLRQPPVLTTVDVEVVAKERDELGNPAIGVRLTRAGTTKFATATANATGKQLAFVINRRVVSTPTVFSQIHGSFQITGDPKDPVFTSAVDALTQP